MPLIGSSTSSVAYRHKRVALARPGPPVPDGEGGWTESTIPLDPPQMWAHVRPVSKQDLEDASGGTVLSTATHFVTLPFHPQVTTETTLTVENYPRPDRLFKVVYVANPNERNADLDLVCAEQVE